MTAAAVEALPFLVLYVACIAGTWAVLRRRP